MPDERRARVQIDAHPDTGVLQPAGTIAWSEHLEVCSKYIRQGFKQTPESIDYHGGFGYYEAEALLGHPLHTWEPR